MLMVMFRRNEHVAGQGRIPGQERDVLIVLSNDLLKLRVVLSRDDGADEARFRANPPFIVVDVERDAFHDNDSAPILLTEAPERHDNYAARCRLIGVVAVSRRS